MNGYRIRSHGMIAGVRSHAVRPFPDSLSAAIRHNVLRRHALADMFVLNALGIWSHTSETVVGPFRIPT